MRKHLLAKAHIAKLNELTVSEVTELSSSTVDRSALPILKRPVSRGIPIESSHRKIQFTIQVLSIFTELTDITVYTGSKERSNCRISPRHLQSVPHVRFCFSPHCTEHNIKPRATTAIQCITKRVGVTVSQHPE
jgi:hypothetical protein